MSTYRPPQELPHLAATDPGLLEAVAAGAARLTPDQGLHLLRTAATPTLGRWADARCRTLHGDSVRTYIIDRNINYTNVCSAKCTFCAFRRDADDHDAYVLPTETIHKKIEELSAIGGTQILMQGGMNPNLPLDYYIELLQSIKQKFPKIHIHAFSPPEFIEFVHFFDPPGANLEEKIRWVMVRLRDAGLDSLPGGGGEIFAKPVRHKIGLGKCDAESWLTTMYVAHSLGMFTSATMMFGHIEGYADRIHHMMLVRQWQDRALSESGDTLPARAGGFGKGGGGKFEGMGHYKAFISWPFQRENTPLGRVKDWGMGGGGEPRRARPALPGRCRRRRARVGRESRGRLPRARPAGGRVRPPRPDVGVDRLPPDAGGVPLVPRQHLFDRRLVGDYGSARRAGGPHVRRVRHGQRHDGGERRVERRHDLLPRRSGDLPAHPRVRVHARPAEQHLRRPPRP